jgi:hypothetical protein
VFFAGFLPAAGILIACLSCEDTNEVTPHAPATRAIEVADTNPSSIKLAFGFCDGEDGLSLMICETLDAGEQLKGRRFKMTSNILREGEYEGFADTRPGGSISGMSSNPRFFEIPSATSICVSEFECLGEVPYANRLSVEWHLKDENDQTIVIRSPVYRVSATADRIIKIIEEKNQNE